jgi:hypothetical protein
MQMIPALVGRQLIPLAVDGKPRPGRTAGDTAYYTSQVIGIGYILWYGLETRYDILFYSLSVGSDNGKDDTSIVGHLDADAPIVDKLVDNTGRIGLFVQSHTIISQR